LLALVAFTLALATPGRDDKAEAQAKVGTGITRVDLNPADPVPLVSIGNDSRIDADGMKFLLITEAGRMPVPEPGAWQLGIGPDCGSGGWSRPTARISPDGSTVWTTSRGDGYTLCAGHGGGFQLQSANAYGWKRFDYVLTRAGRTIYAHRLLAPAPATTASIRVPVTMRLPSGPQAVMTLENGGPGAIARLDVEAAPHHRFREVAADFPARTEVEALSASLRFDYPIEKGEIAELVWSWLGPHDVLDTEVVIRARFTRLVTGAEPVATAYAAVIRREQARRRWIAVRDRRVRQVTVSAFHLREVASGGLEGLRLRPSPGVRVVTFGIASFGAGSHEKPIAVTEDGILDWSRPREKRLRTVRISGLRIDIAEAPTGPIRLHFEGPHAHASILAGAKE
jgi:hypothetical protein